MPRTRWRSASTGRPTEPMTAHTTSLDTPRAPISRTRIEILLARCSAVVAFVLFGLAVPDITVQIPNQSPVLDVLFKAGIPATIIACLLIRRSLLWIRISAGTSALLILAGFVCWHLGLLGDGSQVESKPWSNGIAPIGVALAAVALRPVASLIYNAAFGVALLLVPATASGNTRDWYDAAQDALLCTALGLVIIALMTALRNAATASDEAALRAVSTFGDAARAEAIRVERSRLDALIHDSVMATLIVAAQAQSQEVIRAASKAASAALTELAKMMSTREDDTATIGRQEFLNRLTAATAPYSPIVIQRLHGPDPEDFLPVGASRAIVQATTEAVRNSSRHAGTGPATVTVAAQRSSAASPAEVVVEISDKGPGFDINGIPPRRFGVRVSIIQRMRDADGEAHIVSSPQHGTTVRLVWRDGADSHG